jgi:hypothetical protein
LWVGSNRKMCARIQGGGFGHIVPWADVIFMPGKCFLMDFNDFLDVLGGSRTDEVSMIYWVFLLLQCKSLRYHLVVFMGATPQSSGPAKVST